jgi:hypothetical protein
MSDTSSTVSYKEILEFPGYRVEISDTHVGRILTEKAWRWLSQAKSV